MRTWKRLALAALVIAGLLLPLATATSQPVSASCNVLDIVLGSCTVIGTGPADCSLQQVGAKATYSSESYDYILSCGNVHVVGSYDVNTKSAKEVLTSSGGKVSAVWHCSDDPWISLPGQAPSCERMQIAGTGDAAGADINNATFPLSVSPLSDFSRSVLRAQFQNALKQLPPVSSVPSHASDTMPQPVQYHAASIIGGWPQLSNLTQGEAVTSLQYLLQQSGATLAVDGKFGPETDKAVRAFQKAQGLGVDGVVGPMTWQALIVTVQQDSKGPAVRAVQSQLKSRAVAITVDGTFGTQTDAAVQAYQQSHGLFVDGQVGPQTWQALLAGK